VNHRANLLGALTIVCLHCSPTYAQAPVDAEFERAYQTGIAVAAEGVVSKLYEDDFARHSSVLRYVLRDARSGRRFILRFDHPASELVTGKVLRVRGHAHGSELYVRADQTSPGATSPTTTANGDTAPSSSIDQPTLVVVANFSDATVTCPISDIDGVMFNDSAGLSVASLYRESSLGNVLLSGTVAGPYTIPFGAQDQCDIGVWADAADQQAAAAGINPSGYAHKVYVMPPNSCQAAGYGTVGGSPSGAWIFTCDLKGVFAHELGHNLGMDHASTPDAEYGDSTDPMAYGSTRLRGVNAPHREQLGWLGAQSVQHVSQSGLYTVSALAMDPATAPSPQALVIAKPDTGENYYVAYRVAEGFDNYIDGSYLDKLSVHRYRGDGSSTRTFLVAGLGDGMSFDDTVNGITVTEVGHGPSEATVQVQLRTPCSIDTPALTVSPQAQSGIAGAALTYLVSLTNRDTAQCGATAFDLGASIAPGWTATWSSPSVSLAPGASGQTQLTITSPATAPSGTYIATVDVRASDTPVHAASTIASDTVTPPCAASVPVLSASPPIQAGIAGSTLAYVLTVTNRDAASCSATTFLAQAQQPGGWLVALSASALTLAPGQSGAITVSVTSSVSAVPGNYQVSAAVSDALSSGHTASTSMTDAVQTAIDSLPPTTPSALTATLQTRQKTVKLAWGAATDNVGVSGYRVMRNGAIVATVSGLAWTDTAYIAGATYSYVVVAFDAAGNVSGPSNGVTVVISGGGGAKKR
jgi:gametolysin peptidase M11/alpha-galactosidase-like protein